MPPNGPGVVVGERVVDPHRAGPDLAHAAHRGLEVARVDVRAEPEAGRVRQRDRLVERVHRHDRRHRPEGLLAQQRRSSAGAPVTTAGEKKCPRVEAGAVAADHQLGAGRHGRLHLRLHLRRAAGADTIGPDVGRLRPADRRRAASRVYVDELRDEVVVDLARDVEALGRRAHLAGVQVRRPGAAAGGDLDVAGHVRAHDERVLAAHLEVHPRHPLGARARRPSCRSPPSR